MIGETLVRSFISLREVPFVAEGFMEEERRRYTDFSNVESQRNDLIAEEFPEGPYGSSLLSESLGKSKPWRTDQRPPNSYGYENRELHENRQREYPGDQGDPMEMDEP